MHMDEADRERVTDGGAGDAPQIGMAYRDAIDRAVQLAGFRQNDAGQGDDQSGGCRAPAEQRETPAFTAPPREQHLL